MAKTRRLELRIQPGLLRRLDQYCARKNDLTRTHAVLEALEWYLQSQRASEPELTRGMRRLVRTIVKEEAASS